LPGLSRPRWDRQGNLTAFVALVPGQTVADRSGGEAADDGGAAEGAGHHADGRRASPFIKDVFGGAYQKLYGDTKYKEALISLRTVSDFDYRTYLPRI